MCRHDWKLPKSIYVVVKNDNNESFLLASANMSEVGIEVGDKTKIGLYKLEGFFNAEGLIETGKMQKK